MRKIWILAVIIAIGVAVYLRQSADQPVEQTAEDAPSTALVSIVLPESLSAQATAGKTIFDANCAACHGLNAVGRLAWPRRSSTSSMSRPITVMSPFKGPSPWACASITGPLAICQKSRV